MKTKQKNPLIIRSGLLAMLISIAWVGSASADNVYWEGGTTDFSGDGNFLSAGGSGTWNTTTLNWDYGLSGYIAWNNDFSDTAHFGGVAGTVTVHALDETLQPVPMVVYGLVFSVSNGGYTLNGTPLALGAGGITNSQTSGVTTLNTDLQLQAAQSWQNNGGTLTVGGKISGNVLLTLPATGGSVNLNGEISQLTGITKTGGATLSLGAANTFNADTLLGGGTTNFAVDGAINHTAQLYLGTTAGQNVAQTLNVNGNISVGGLTARYVNNTATTVTIASGKKMTVNGNLLIGAAQTNVTPTRLTVSGSNGTLEVNKTGGVVRVGSSSGFSGAVLDLSGLGTFTSDLGSTGTLAVGADTNFNGSNANQNSSLTLAASNTIKANALTISAHHLAGTTAITNTLLLGSGTNQLNVNGIYLGPFESTGNTSRSTTAGLRFAGANGSVKVRAADGVGRANVEIGTVLKSFSNITANVDFSGHQADLLIGTLAVGQFMGTGTTSGSYPAVGTLKFDQGVLDANGLVIGKNTIANGSATGTVTIGGGTVTIGSGGITVGGSSGGSGTLNLTGGQISLSGPVTRVGASSVATLNLDGATLDLGNYAIGGALAINQLNLLSGTLKNVAQINNGATPLTKTGSGSLVLDGQLSYTGNTVVSEGTLTLAENSVLKFTVTDTASNSISGSGALVLRGAFQIQTSAVSLTSGSWVLVDTQNLNESFEASFSVTGAGWSKSGSNWIRVDGAKLWTFSPANGTLTVAPNSSTPYQQWAQDSGLSTEAADKSLDPDQDGTKNLLEFAIAGNPRSGASTGVLDSRVRVIEGVSYLTVTVATRSGTTFSAGSGPRVGLNVAQGITYRVEGTANLADWNDSIVEVVPAIVDGVPNQPPTGYEYHTFRRATPVGGAGSGFIRIVVME